MNASQCTTTTNGLRSTTGIYGFHELKPQLFPEDEELPAKGRVYPYSYSRRVKEAIHIRLHPNNINRESGIEIPEVWMPTIRQLLREQYSVS